jgi:hypothetical protein
MSEKIIAMAARFAKSEAEQINNWRRAQERIPPMSEALRILVMRGLRVNSTSPGEERQ